ncbi:cation transporter [Geothrix sp. SG200]|uniref:cation transporter n=1 Tax=Geothrix sp. SG200 TaxID=2922865 RepID=UPI001FACA0DB|nr:cation transporter [Geothrix sp. SG200]
MSGPDWRRRALWLAGFTIAYNLLEGLVSMAFGWAGDSVALFGFGADSFIEVASALLVLWKLLDHGNLERERKATLGIGRLFLFLAAGIAGGAVLQLTARAHPPTTVPGLVISALSLAFMVFLWRAKLRAAQALDSATVAADAACSRACIQLSVVLFAGSLLFLLAPALWWVDAAAALGLAFLIGKEGLGMTRAAKSACFTGGCGCGH